MTGTGLATRDLTSRDFTFASVCTIAVFVAASFALRHARLEHHAQLPTIDPGNAIPIAVRPVADIGPVGEKRGGAKPKPTRKRKSSSKPTQATPEPEVAPPAEAAVPSAWQRKPREPPPQLTDPTPTPLPDVVPPPTEPDQTPTPEPTTEEDTPVTPEDATEAPAEPDASSEAGGEEGQAGTGSGASGEGPGGGGTQPGEGEGDAVGDPLLDRAIAFYRARLVAWFAARFRVTGSGLSPEQLAKYRVRARIEIGEDLRIVDYKVLSSDHPTFEKAARTTLDGLRGETLPPPPENYPGAVQRQLTVSFTCTEDACD